ncbi:DNA-binding protein [Streptomyces albus subsp. albus]|nr:DNA-binding protein [Streptomyces albus subsp. albus]
MQQAQSAQGNRVSTVLGRRLGGELLTLRTAAGLTQSQAARALSASTGKVAKMESGWAPMRDPDIRILCDLYEVEDPTVVGGLLELARVDRDRRKAKGWWSSAPVAPAMREYVSLESAAIAIKTWQIAYVPGLLQSEGYVRALNPDEHFVTARLSRQRRLEGDNPLHLRAVIYEAVLRNLVGGPDVMRGQLNHLASMAEKPNVSIRVVPFSAGAKSGIDCGFNILSFAEPGAMDVVYIEIPRTQAWIEGGREAAEHDAMFEKITAHALRECESRTFITSLCKDL